MRSSVSSALSYQSNALRSAGSAGDVIRTAANAIDRAIEDARYVAGDAPGRDVTSQASSLGSNASNAGSAFSSAGSDAYYGG